MKSDLDIQQDVINELKWHPFLHASDIGVTVRNGIVTLSGQVDSYAHKLEAERAAKKVSGVKALAEDMQIGVSPSPLKTDAELAALVLDALKWNSAVPDEKVKVKVESGEVTLEGEVDWDYQRTSAHNAVSRLLGVRNVVNLLRVKPKVSVADIKQKISSAFHRAATIDAEKITVEITGNRAVLRGVVRSFAEKEDAEEAAWCAPGIAEVQNLLEVQEEEVYTF